LTLITKACETIKLFTEWLQVSSKKLSWNSRISHYLELKDVTSFERYMKMEKLLSRLGSARTILDAGSGGVSPLKKMGQQVLSLDVRRKTGLDVIADVRHLPFQRGAFNIVTAADLLEHLKFEDRKKAVQEMKRTGTIVIIHVPLQDDLNFMGAVGDLMFYKFTKEVLGKPEENTDEHLKCGHPSPTELRGLNLEVVDTDWNLTVWFTAMKLHYLSHGLLSPIINTMYFLLLSRIRHPPWWGAWLIFDGRTLKKNFA